MAVATQLAGGGGRSLVKLKLTVRKASDIGVVKPVKQFGVDDGLLIIRNQRLLKS